jgi:ABC-2 type transport system permease protein
MRPRIVGTIFRKDLFDAVRDARVLVAILLPVGLALFYNFISEGAEQRPEATVYHTASLPGSLPEALREATRGSVDPTFREAASPGEVRRAVRDGSGDIGLIAAPNFERAVRQGETPELTVVLPESPDAGALGVSDALDGALRLLAGQEPPAVVRGETVEGGEEDLLGAGVRQVLLATGIMLLIAMISLYAVPVILTEETEKKTLDALTMVATYGEVVAAKALVGLVLSAVSTALLLLVVRTSPADAPTFVAGIALLAVALVGFGLLMGGLFKNANQLNTWSTFPLLLLLVPAYAVIYDPPEPLGTAFSLLPTGAATRLAINGLSGEAAFPNAPLYLLILATWAVLAYATLAWTLRRREA